VKDVNRLRELHRVYSTVCVAVVRRDDFQHGPATEAFERLDGRVLLAALRAVQCIPDVR
jgi:hypothetical protein